MIYFSFTLNRDLQTYSYTKDCSELFKALILCSVVLDSWSKTLHQ